MTSLYLSFILQVNLTVDGYIAVIHESMPRKQFLHAFTKDGKTQYKPILVQQKIVYLNPSF